MSSAAKPIPTAPPSLDTELQSAVRRVMHGDAVDPGDMAQVQEILDRKANQIRSTFSDKVRLAQQRNLKAAG